MTQIGWDGEIILDGSTPGYYGGTTYGDMLSLVQELNTGASTPEQIALIFKLVLNQIAAKKLRSRIKLGSITTNGDIYFVLGTALCLPDFLDIKTSGGDFNRCIYYKDSVQSPIFMPIKPYSRFKLEQGSGACALEGRNLYISEGYNSTVPTTIYIPYYSKYLVLDADGETEKERPENSGDTFLLPSEFDPVIVDGVLLYLSRREKQDKEWQKNYKNWIDSLSNLMFLQ